MPRIWKYRGREVSPAQLRLGTSASTSSRCCCPALRRVAASRTDTLAGTSISADGRYVPVTTTSLSGDPTSGDGSAETARAVAETNTKRNETRNVLRKLPAPYAGTNRIRFNGFAGSTGISGPAGPPQGL